MLTFTEKLQRIQLFSKAKRTQPMCEENSRQHTDINRDQIYRIVCTKFSLPEVSKYYNNKFQVSLLSYLSSGGLGRKLSSTLTISHLRPVVVISSTRTALKLVLTSPDQLEY